jgi:hypothetical protein
MDPAWRASKAVGSESLKIHVEVFDRAALATGPYSWGHDIQVYVILCGLE